MPDMSTMRSSPLNSPGRPLYTIKRNEKDPRNFDWTPGWQTEELDRAIHLSFPLYQTLEEKYSAAIDQFIQGEKASGAGQYQASPQFAVQAPQVQLPQVTPAFKSVSAVTKQSVVPKVYKFVDETKGAAGRKKQSAEVAKRIADNRGNVCARHARTKKLCDPLKCKDNKQYQRNHAHQAQPSNVSLVPSETIVAEDLPTPSSMYTDTSNSTYDPGHSSSSTIPDAMMGAFPSTTSNPQTPFYSPPPNYYPGPSPAPNYPSQQLSPPLPSRPLDPLSPPLPQRPSYDAPPSSRHSANYDYYHPEEVPLPPSHPGSTPSLAEVWYPPQYVAPWEVECLSVNNMEGSGYDFPDLGGDKAREMDRDFSKELEDISKAFADVNIKKEKAPKWKKTIATMQRLKNRLRVV